MLKKLILLSLLSPLSLLAQDVSVRYQSQVIGSRGLPLANQSVAVCTQPAVTTTQPCSPLATLATSTSTTSGGANPLTTDILGNFFFYAPPGKYTVQIYGPQVGTPFVVPDTILTCSPSGVCTSFTQLFGCQHVNATQTFAQALAVGGVTCIILDPGTFPVSTSVTVPSTVGLAFSKGGLLSIATGVTLTINSPIYASPDAQIFSYAGTGVAVLGGPNAVVSSAWFPGADVCAQINNTLLALQNGGGNAGGFIDSRHYSGNQPCASNPFAGITIPFDLQTGFYSITLSVPWIHTGGQQVVEGYVNANPATLIASASWPVATISTSTLTSNVITIVTSAAHSFTASDIGNAVALFGQSDATLDGVYVIRSVADNTHLTVNSPLSNRSATGGTATRPMIQIGNLSALNLSETGYRGINLNGNSVVRVNFYNSGEELTGLRRAVCTNFMARCIYAGGTDAGTGLGNHYYDDLHMLWASTADTIVNCVEAKNIPSTQPIGIYNATCARNGGSVTAPNGIFLNASSASINKIHFESCTNAIQMKSNGITFLSQIANSGCATTLLMDASGEQVSASILQGGATNTVVNNASGTTLTGNLTMYEATSNGGEQWQKDDATKQTVVTHLGTATNCNVNSVSPAACGSAASGVFVVPTTTTTYTVNSTSVSATSRIFLQPITDNSGITGAPTCAAVAVTSSFNPSARVAGTSFTFTLPSTTGTTCWNYWILN